MLPASEFNLPRAIRRLRCGQRKWGFGELDKITPAGVCCQQQIASQFRAVFGRLPDGLALLQPPARGGKISGRQRRGRAARDAEDQRENRAA